ncbi:MAG: hypothetical protein ABI557_08260 [Aureliella sp.]
MHAQQIFNYALLVVIIHTLGCQSWQGASFPMQNATRVAPPGTGTYQLPQGYYNNINNTSALTPAPQTMQASNDASGSLRTASGPLPTTNLSASGSVAFQPANSVGGGVVPAAFQSEASNLSAGATSSFNNSNRFGDSGSANSASLSDAPNTEAPSLQWQQ